MINVSTWSIRNPIPSIVFFILLTFAGLVTFKMTGIQDFPDIELPMVTVSASLPGAAPAQLETEVARWIENSVASLQGVKHIYTNILDGSANIIVEFNLEKNASEATNEVRDAVSQVRADLPAEMRDPVVTKAATTGKPILTYTVASDKVDEEAVSWFIDNAVTKRMLAAPGVGKVGRLGGVTREVQVVLDPQKLQSLGATAADVSQALRRTQLETPGGRGDVGGAEQAVRTIATASSVAELAAMDLPLADGRRLASGPGGDRQGHHRGASFRCAAGWQAGGGVRDHALQGRQRNRGGQGRAQGRGRAARRAPGNADRRSAGRCVAGAGELRRFHDPLVRGRDSRRARRVVFPARMARHAGVGCRAAAVGDSHVHRHVLLRLHAQHGDLALAGTGGGHPGGRRHRGDREHHAAHAHGQDAPCRPRWRQRTRLASRSSPPLSR